MAYGIGGTEGRSRRAEIRARGRIRLTVVLLAAAAIAFYAATILHYGHLLR